MMHINLRYKMSDCYEFLLVMQSISRGSFCMQGYLWPYVRAMAIESFTVSAFDR